MADTHANVVFLTTYPNDRPTSSELSGTLEQRGARTSFLCWREAGLTVEAFAGYTHAVILTTGDYNKFIEDFYAFLDRLLEPAVAKFGIRVVNDIDVARWNSNKIYLQDLLQHGLPVPGTTFVKAAGSVDAVREALKARESNEPVVVKPSISASGYSTHVVKKPHDIDNDPGSLEFLKEAVNQPADCYVMLQEFMPGISKGEYSLCYIGGRLIAMALKVPASGEWRINNRYGGQVSILTEDQYPDEAVKVAQRVVAYLDDKFGTAAKSSKKPAYPGVTYARIDGVLNDRGEFVLMEIELLEPGFALSLGDHGPKILAAICDEILSPKV